jgi:hypothetical protein
MKVDPSVHGSYPMESHSAIPREVFRMVFAYFGPETMMPVASIIAAVAGVAMMFGRNLVYFFRSLYRRVAGPRRR